MKPTGRFSRARVFVSGIALLGLLAGSEALGAQSGPKPKRPGKVYIKHDLNQGKAALSYTTEEPVAGPARDAVMRTRVPILRAARSSARVHVDPGALYERRLAMYGESATFDQSLPRTASEDGDPDGGRRRRPRPAGDPDDSRGFPWTFLGILAASTASLVLVIRFLGNPRRRT